jgi:hypothetical protein
VASLSGDESRAASLTWRRVAQRREIFKGIALQRSVSSSPPWEAFRVLITTPRRINVWDRFCEDRRTGRTHRRAQPVTRQRRACPSLLEELQALQDNLDASEERSTILEPFCLMIYYGGFSPARNSRGDLPVHRRQA